MTTPTYVRNDKGFAITFQVKDSSGTVVNITGATVKFKMRLSSATILKVDGTCTITDGPNGKCSYTVAATDFDTTGYYVAELEVTFSGGTQIQTAPLEDVRIIPDLP